MAAWCRSVCCTHPADVGGNGARRQGVRARGVCAGAPMQARVRVPFPKRAACTPSLTLYNYLGTTRVLRLLLLCRLRRRVRPPPRGKACGCAAGGRPLVLGKCCWWCCIVRWVAMLRVVKSLNHSASGL